MVCLWNALGSGKLDFDFAALAMFWSRQNLFNEKELRGRRWLGAQKWVARCPVFDGLSDFRQGLIYYCVVKTVWVFLSEGLGISNTTIVCIRPQYHSPFYPECEIATWVLHIHTHAWHIIWKSTQRIEIKLSVLHLKDSSPWSIMYALFLINTAFVSHFFCWPENVFYLDEWAE